MNVKLKRLLLPLLKAVKEGRPISFRMRSAASQGLFLIGRGIKKPSKGVRLRRVSGLTTKEIRETVFLRAAGRCEASYYSTAADETFRCPHEPRHLDHWLSGSGRRREKQSIETCWALCVTCHDERTRNFPRAMHWNRIFRLHCEQYGYPATAHIDHQELPRRAQP